jgi:hypothetical protein
MNLIRVTRDNGQAVVVNTEQITVILWSGDRWQIRFTDNTEIDVTPSNAAVIGAPDGPTTLAFLKKAPG